MRTITTPVYTFDELSKDAQQKAIEDHREFLSRDWNPEFLLDEWKAKLTDLGYDEPTISWSGFSSQGDGASFTARIDVIKWVKAHKLANTYRLSYNSGDCVSMELKRIDHSYVHWNTIRVTWENIGYDNKDNDKFEAHIETIAGLVQAEAQELSRQLYRELEDLYDNDTSDEAVADNIRANGYEYYASGKLV